MMARWDLQALQAEMPTFSSPLTLVAAEGDHAVPPDVAKEVQGVIPNSRLIPLPGLGHLAHEEDPGAHRRDRPCGGERLKAVEHAHGLLRPPRTRL